MDNRELEKIYKSETGAKETWSCFGGDPIDPDEENNDMYGNPVPCRSHIEVYVEAPTKHYFEWLTNKAKLAVQPQKIKEQSDSTASPVQQLKAEIAALVEGYDKLENVDEWVEATYLGVVVKKLRQLSAV